MQQVVLILLHSEVFLCVTQTNYHLNSPTTTKSADDSHSPRLLTMHAYNTSACKVKLNSKVKNVHVQPWNIVVTYIPPLIIYFARSYALTSTSLVDFHSSFLSARRTIITN
jgi:hypothetical protein